MTRCQWVCAAFNGLLGLFYGAGVVRVAARGLRGLFGL